MRDVVGVWVGNAGAGRPTLTGVTSAAPILFDILIYCQDNDGLIRQLRDLEEVEVHTLSGHLAKVVQQ
jgi:penicillin-binding protein 1C